ncbi:GNAT family N-acetyltransferase [Arcticibacter eurypsychrophilus]|uniref:N-acetyltransferase n=1 Tax=Arcticibacter eurypsychrophilus TaxID=1434752 RepID=UPI000A82B128|nr:N-acetyltransferase [Arcticibacter eurypsychrophilus]
MEEHSIVVRVATLKDIKHVNQIIQETHQSALQRGIGISNRTPESIVAKMRDGKSIIAVTDKGEWVGFSYFEVWESGKFVSNSGLIVSPDFRHTGVAKAIKERIFKLSREKYPTAKIFSITSGIAVMKMNTLLDFEPVTFQQITQDEKFWGGCKSCVNFNLLGYISFIGSLDMIHEKVDVHAYCLSTHPSSL